jgi:subtilisin family serine protease
VVAAAGNQNRSTPHYPAALDNVIAVGAAEPRPKEGGWQRTRFSNFGRWVNLWAPGREVVSTYIDFPNDKGLNRERSWARWDGTSFSAAIVSGRVAAIMEADGGTAWEAVNRVLAESPARVDLRDEDAEVPRLGPLVEPDPRSRLAYLGR